MAEFETQPRREGPTIVADGPEDGPAIVVLDPAGAAKHEEIPASWRELARQRRVIWARIPAGQALAEAERKLSELTAAAPAVDVVTSGPVAEAAMDFVLRRAESVRALLLADPGAPDERFATEDAETADALWQQRSRERIEEVERWGVAVRVIAHSSGGSDDQVSPPLPLGHPDVVETVSAAVGDLDTG